MGAPLPGAVVSLATAAVGGVRLGIPVDAVVQAIPVPASTALLPRRTGALCGVVVHEGTLVPVVDLARWVDVGTAPVAALGSARILVLHEAGRTLGLQVDTVDGLVDVACAAIARLHHDDRPDEVFHSAAQAADGRILSLLDVGRLATLAASWHQHDGQPALAPHAPPPGHGALRTVDYALLELDTLQPDMTRLGVAACDVAEVMPMPALERFEGTIDSAWCLWRGRHLPVLGGGALPGLPDAGAAPLLAIVEHDGLALGLPVRAALALRSFGAADAAGSLTTTVYEDDGKALRLLDTAALFARFPEALLSRTEHAAADRPAQDGGTSNDSAYIVFEAGHMAATPIAAVEHILPLAPGHADGPGATMPWHGSAIHLVELRPGTQRGAGAPGHVLVASGAGKATGYVVSRVALLVPSGAGKLYRMKAAAGGARAFVTVDGADGLASYRIVDLAEAATAIQAPQALRA